MTCKAGERKPDVRFWVTGIGLAIPQPFLLATGIFCQRIARRFSIAAFKPIQGTASDRSATFTKLMVLRAGRRVVGMT